MHDLPPPPKEKGAKASSQGDGRPESVADKAGIECEGQPEGEPPVPDDLVVEGIFLYNSIGSRLLERALKLLASVQREELLAVKQAYTSERRVALVHFCQLEADLVAKAAKQDLSEFEMQMSTHLLGETEQSVAELRSQLSEQVHEQVSMHQAVYQRKIEGEEQKIVKERRKWLTERLVLMSANGGTAPSNKALLGRFRQELRACETKIALYDNEVAAKSRASRPPSVPTKQATAAVAEAPSKPPQMRKPVEAASDPAQASKVSKSDDIKPVKSQPQQQAQVHEAASRLLPPHQQHHQQQLLLEQHLQELQQHQQQQLLDLQRQQLDHFQQLHSQFPHAQHTQDRQTPDFPGNPPVPMELHSPLSAAPPGFSALKSESMQPMQPSQPRSAREPRSLPLQPLVGPRFGANLSSAPAPLFHTGRESPDFGAKGQTQDAPWYDWPECDPGLAGSRGGTSLRSLSVPTQGQARVKVPETLAPLKQQPFTPRRPESPEPPMHPHFAAVSVGARCVGSLGAHKVPAADALYNDVGTPRSLSKPRPRNNSVPPLLPPVRTPR